ncbi:hypothetical protein J3R30DRAFT_3412109 [Lentinula aciculospora]|uniref:Integral membrane protein n=1 Tax=Lentinula aciculospora TaxID=153920 RepID=A0A9W9DEQ0_9AGAR|nr:hypothetical protein J3R30DRAFT_3412109 [Lentinula aciculospora]
MVPDILWMYNFALEQRPMFVQCCTVATLFGFGDIVAQVIEGRRQKRDVARTARLIFYGVSIVFFFSSMSMLEGKPKEAIRKIKAAYIPTIIRNWVVFIPTQIINFAIIPHHLRFIVVSIVNTYLSVANARQTKLATQGLSMSEPSKLRKLTDIEAEVEKKGA